MSIKLSEHRAGISKRLIRRFSDDKQPKQGLASFFPTVTSPTRRVSIEIQRNLQKVAVDVQRCTDPVRNIFSKFTEKIFEPPYYNEMFDFTSCQRYEETFGGGNPPTMIDAQMILNESTSNLIALKNKILRAIELQRSQVLQSGIVQLKNGDSINFKRRAESMKVLTGTNQWTDGDNSNPLEDLNLGMTFIREKGLSGGTSINAIFGKNALSNFLSNPKVKELADFRNIKRVEINMPQFDNTSGMVFHGQIATGDYLINIWTYNEVYEDPIDGTTKSYIDPDNVIMVSEDFVGNTAFAGVPALLGDGVKEKWVGPKEAEFYVRDVIDQVKLTWDFIVSSAPLVVPVSIDRIYTLKTAKKE